MDIILVTAIDDGQDGGSSHPNIDLLNEFLDDDSKLARLDNLARAGTVMQCDVFTAASRHFDIKEFIAGFHSIKWQHPESVQLMLKDENEDSFRVFHTV